VSGVDQLQYLSWALFLIVFVAVLVRTVRRPTPAHVDMTLFFGVVALLIVLSGLTTRLHVLSVSWLSTVSGAAAMSLGYLLLRLVRDFSRVPLLVIRAVEVGLIASIGALVFLPAPVPVVITLALIAYLVLILAYDAWAFAQQALHTRGVTRRRMQAAAGGTLALTLALLIAGLSVGLPDWAGLWTELSAVCGLASGACYFVAFAPPTWLRRAWQEPELRAFLLRAPALTRVPEPRLVVQELERRAADALGAPAASILLWDADRHRLRTYYVPPPNVPDAESAPDGLARAIADGIWEVDPTTRPVIARAFIEQRASLTNDAPAADPANAALLELYNARTMLAAPITAFEKRFGVLVIYAPRSPVFANSDLELVQLLADQSAVILESRVLIEESARIQAREESARLKEDFLSSAAHDLKTPLTGLVTQAQVLQRRMQRNPSAPADPAGIDRMLQQSLRLRDLVLELLDVSRLERGGLVGNRVDVDIATLVKELIARDSHAWQRVTVDANEEVIAPIDAVRFEQVLTNLIENGLKYSSHEEQVRVRVWRDDTDARLSVQDRGIGIPSEDQPLVFERFHRARNVDHRRFAGMGLGLYIARGIVLEHNGRIWVHSTPGEGSTFFVTLPLSAPSSSSGAPVSQRLANSG
jgi:signal transduction histidine kinase